MSNRMIFVTCEWLTAVIAIYMGVFIAHGLFLYAACLVIPVTVVEAIANIVNPRQHNYMLIGGEQ